MSKPITIANTFAAQTGPIPLSQLDADFAQVVAAINDPATYQNYVVDTGAANAYVVTPNPAWTSYAAGMMLQFLAANGNTTASTVNVSGLGAKNIVTPQLLSLTSGTISAGSIISLQYDGTQFQLIGSAANSFPVFDDSINDFRLSLSSGVPVTTADVTGATTVYATPYKGNRIALYNGSVWNTRISAEFSLALGTLTSGKPYDVFCYDNAGVATLEFLVWTNDTTRATGLVYQDGVLVKSGALTRRYLGTFYTTATTTTEDSAAKRLLWNYYNRVVRKCLVQDTTDSWTYTIAVFRQFRASSVNQLAMVRGVDEDAVFSLVTGIATGQSNSNSIVGIGLDSTSAKATDSLTGSGNLVTGGTPQSATAIYQGLPGLGYHILVPLEYSTAAGTTTWYGDNGGTVTQSGISAQVMA